jgi:outer membrane protein assembly factor BamB
MRAVAGWVIVTLVAVGLVGVAVRSARAAGTSLLDRLVPDAPGTTWVYHDITNGTPTGTATVRVATTAVSIGVRGPLLDVHVDNYLGRGSPHDEIRFQAKQNNRLVMVGYRQSGTFSQFTPPQIQLELPVQPGHTFTWRGKRDSPAADLSVTTRVVGIESLAVAGHPQTGCVHLHDDAVESSPSQPEFPTSVDRWLCPGLGEVRDHFDAPTAGVHVDEELQSVHGPGINLGPPTPAATDTSPSTTPATPAPATPAPATPAPATPATSTTPPAAEIDPSRLAWSDTRVSLIQFPPAGREGLVVVEEENGRVAAFDPAGGKARWDVEIAVPAAASPVVAADTVFVPDAAKHLLALDPANGATRWAASFDDVVSVPPLVVGDSALVATEDGRLHSLGVADGRSRWDATLSAPPSGLAPLGSDVIVTTTDGTVSAVSATSGSIRWTGTLQGKWSAGPVAGSGVVVVADDQGVLSAFDSTTGHIRWTDYLRTNLNVPMALAGSTLSGSIVLVPDGNRIRTFDLSTGRPRWTADVGGTSSAATVVGADVFVATRDNLVRLALTDGSRRSAQALPRFGPGLRPRTAMVPTMIAGQLLVTLTLDAGAGWPRTTILAFLDRQDPAVGGVRFTGEFRVVPSSPARAPVLRDNDLLLTTGDAVYDAPPRGPVRTVTTAKARGSFLVSSATMVLARDGDSLVATGPSGRLWTYPLGSPSFIDVPAIGRERVFAPITGKGLVALSPETGQLQWLFPTTGPGGSTPLVLAGGDVVYGVGGLTRLGGATGSVRWQVPGFEAFGPLTDDGGTIYAAGLHNGEEALLAVDEATGAIKWRIAVPVKFLSSPAAARGSVAAIGGDNVVRVFDAGSGRLRWDLPLSTPPAGPPVIVGDRLVIAEQGRLEDAVQLDHRLSVYDLATGRFLGAFEPGGSAFSVDSFAGADGRLLFPTLAGGFIGVYILGLGSP